MMREIFALWRYKINSVSAAARPEIVEYPSSAAQIGAKVAATNAESDEMRNANAVTSHVRHAAIPTGHAIANKIPKNVATPLPP